MPLSYTANAGVSLEELKHFFLDKECQFEPSLATLTDFDSYLEKLHKFASFYVCREQTGELVALLAGYANNLETREAFLSALMVRASYRNCGIAQHLLNEFIKDLQKKSFITIRLSVLTTNSKALAFYKKNNFFYQLRHQEWFDLVKHLK